jgi:hypothetical protein
MHKSAYLRFFSLILLVLFLVTCQGYTEVGARTRSTQDMNGGSLNVQISKANGTSQRSIEVTGGSDTTLEADVTLTVAKGTYTIELLGAGGDDEVTLILEASDGQTVSGHGQMVVDSFDEANYRVTATGAENVEYTIVYTYK